MYCRNCGIPLPEDARFCPKCGTPVLEEAPRPPGEEDSVPEEVVGPPLEEEEEPVDQVPEEEAIPENDGAPYIPPEFFQDEPPMAAEEKPAPAKKKQTPLLIAIGVVAVALIACIALFVNMNTENGAYRDAMRSAEDAMKSGDYALAIDFYQTALELKPDKTEPVLGMAKAYLCLGDYAEAEALLTDLEIPEGEKGYDLRRKLLTLIRLAGTSLQVDAGAFPEITVIVEDTGDFALEKKDFAILEGDESRTIDEAQETGSGIRLTYEAEESFLSEEARGVSLVVTVEEVQLILEGDYITPYFEEAHLSMVTTDVSEYPKVRVYFQITDADGDPLTNLSASSFVVKERVEGGQFLAREVKDAFILEENAGLNISLAADKSGSISFSDLEKIKRVMSDFVRQLNFRVGDRAEILSFDDIVQQMCFYTNDLTLLLNGIDNMSPGDCTAFYDAVYDGVTNSALQGGARCVVAFTDGMDNASEHSANEVVSYAISKQVPVYIIGVGGSVETQTLRSMATQTGGQYWHIDDLYDLEVIFNQVYAEQMQLYVVEYESDKSLDPYLTRDLTIRVDGGSCRGEESFTFTPVRSLTEEEKSRSTRYELVKGVYSWEEADQKCRDMGGHLATITSQSEMDTLTKMLEDNDLKYAWLGGYTSYDENDNVYGHWVTGEDFSYEAWTVNEPSRVDADGVSEWYIMLWYLPDYGGWSWNDQRNYPFPANVKLEKSAAFICEYEY